MPRPTQHAAPPQFEYDEYDEDGGSDFEDEVAELAEAMANEFGTYDGDGAPGIRPPYLKKI